MQLVPHSCWLPGQAHTPLPLQLCAAGHAWPQEPQLDLSVLKLVQPVPQAFGVVPEQAQTPAEHVLPFVVQSWQPEVEPQLAESLELL
jgi:hypothetical protein